jgi:uncharacterized integral membrane protein
MSVPLYESLTALALIFVLPGFALSRAIFPEWRFRGRGGAEHLAETAAMSLVLSVSLTILVGFALQNSPSVGFQASWSFPLLEVLLAGVAGGALVTALYRGAFSKIPPLRIPARRERPGTDAWEILDRLDEFALKERRLAHAIRTGEPSSPEVLRAKEELSRLHDQTDELRQLREREYVD